MARRGQWLVVGTSSDVQRIASTNAAMSRVVATAAEDLPYVSLCAVHKWNAARQGILRVDPETMSVETSRRESVDSFVATHKRRLAKSAPAGVALTGRSNTSAKRQKGSR